MMFQEIDPHKFKIEYINDTPRDDDFAVIVRDNCVLMVKGEEASLPTVAQIRTAGEGKAEYRYLFRIDDKAFYAAANVDELPDGVYEYVRVRDMRRMKPMWIAYGATVAYRLVAFYEEHRFCGKCGAECEHSMTERAMVCPSCGYTAYPQISPSAIILIRNGDKAVLTKYQASHSSYRNYALVAGYIETGETPEEAVKREVFEEVGLRVKNVRYYKSQPWPLSGARIHMRS